MNKKLVFDGDRIYNLLPQACHHFCNREEFGVLCDSTIDKRTRNWYFRSKDLLFKEIRIVLYQYKLSGLKFLELGFELTVLEKAEEVLLSCK